MIIGSCATHGLMDWCSRGRWRDLHGRVSRKAWQVPCPNVPDKNAAGRVNQDKLFCQDEADDVFPDGFNDQNNQVKQIFYY